MLLGAFEALLVWYWVALKLPDVLLYGAVLGLVTALVGNQALATIARRRTGRKKEKIRAGHSDTYS